MSYKSDYEATWIGTVCTWRMDTYDDMRAENRLLGEGGFVCAALTFWHVCVSVYVRETR